MNKPRYNNNNVKRDKVIRAECKEMCPDYEFNLRVKNNLVNFLEKKILDNKIQYCLVKEYSRPAAGKQIRSTDLRTLDTLVRTTRYLAQDVYNRAGVNYIQLYEFLFDRFRAIRQDLIIQRCVQQEALDILYIILKFYILADYKLCSNKSYDEFMNYQHLSEVLQILISHEKQPNLKPILYSIFVLLNIHNLNSEILAIKRFKEYRNVSPLNDSIALVKAYLQGNYVRVFRLYKQLPLICQLALHRRLTRIQNLMINQYNSAFSFKNSKFPLEKFYDLIQMNNLNKFINANLIVLDNENNILFSKQNLHTFIKESRETYKHIDDRLTNVCESDFILN